MSLNIEVWVGHQWGTYYTITAQYRYSVYRQRLPSNLASGIMLAVISVLIPVSVAGSNIGVLRLPPGWDATNCM